MDQKNSLLQFARDMPKAELHVHLEGTLEPRLARSLAVRNNVQLNLPPETPDHSYPFHDLPSFLDVYYGAMSVLKTSHDFEDLTAAYLKKAHQQNVKHVEIFFDPQAHTTRGVPFQEVISGIHRALVRAPEEFGMSASAIMCFLRDHSAASAMETLETATISPHRDIIVGVGLDSNELDNPPEKFKSVFQTVRNQIPHWKITVHCDVDQKDSIQHIRQAIEDIAVDRIDHGTNIIEDKALVAKAIEKRIGLTCCTLSNNVICEGFKSAEIMDLTRQGMAVTINSDDPAYFKGYVNESLELLINGSTVTRAELIQLQKNAFEIAWVDDKRRAELMDMLDDFVSSEPRS